ncbi:hypothetical protein GCM10007897_24150 [Sphingobium jiangsuense]|uniref:Uncharacterized protein n=1 Tax=Sphingobium jiangsuense TaxID=870476 RepID=A0A7W6BK89_9SPHN|nr:hypothetical protein [Sphingobium jiangsuense]MBB3928610.1 hypothetical protein [Sphingobium jiangsuense]GLT01024.1 hypothetical protein GCM10007897_24150 [Sphingobium jiangsuense]
MDQTDHRNGVPATGAARLYSETPIDERGNFHYQGDLQQRNESLTSLAGRIGQHLHALFPAMRFSISTERFAGGRKITAELLDAPDDLTGREAQQEFTVRVRDQMERFGFCRSNLLQDFHTCSFFCEVRIGQAYWTTQAKRQGARSRIEPLVSLAAFRHRLKPGDRMKLIEGPAWHRAIGTMRTVEAVRSKDIIFEGKIYLDLPRAAQFACDGKLVEFAIGTEQEPGAHLLYEWLPQKAA